MCLFKKNLLMLQVKVKNQFFQLQKRNVIKKDYLYVI